MIKDFLPICRADMEARGWDNVDFVYVIGDAYVDHPSFGHAIISRILEANNYRVGIISQPDWKSKKSIDIYGRPRLGFIISAGNMDSMVNHYTVSKKRRHNDAFTPGGVYGKRPDYATVVYGNLIRQTYKDVPVIIGGIDASLRRLAHYDYWSDTVKRSILLDSGADLLLYGMGERSIVEAGRCSGQQVWISGTLHSCPVLSIRQNLWILSMTPFVSLLLRISQRVNENMRKVFILSTLIRTHSVVSVWWKAMENISMSFRIRRQNR